MQQILAQPDIHKVAGGSRYGRVARTRCLGQNANSWLKADALGGNNYRFDSMLDAMMHVGDMHFQAAESALNWFILDFGQHDNEISNRIHHYTDVS